MPIVEIDATIAGDSSVNSSAGVLYQSSLSVLGSSSVSSNAGLKRQGTAAIVGSSTFTAFGGILDHTTVSMAGNSSLTVDPTKVTIVNFSRGPQIPESAKPLTVATVRITPPAPPSPSYSIGSPPRKNRQGL